MSIKTSILNTLLFLCSITLSNLTAYSQAKNTEILKFKNFKVAIYDFISQCPVDNGNIHSSDTLSICENPCDGDRWYITGKIFKIISNLKNEHFEVSFAYQVDIAEVKEVLDGKEENFVYFTRYETIFPVKKNEFKIAKYKDYGYTKSIKKKYGFNDTFVEGSTESGPFTYRFTKNGKIYSDNWTNLILRIKSFKRKKLVDIKYIVIGLTEDCD